MITLKIVKASEKTSADLTIPGNTSLILLRNRIKDSGAAKANDTPLTLIDSKPSTLSSELSRTLEIPKSVSTALISPIFGRSRSTFPGLMSQ